MKQIILSLVMLIMFSACTKRTVVVNNNVNNSYKVKHLNSNSPKHPNTTNPGHTKKAPVRVLTAPVPAKASAKPAGAVVKKAPAPAPASTPAKKKKES